MSKLSSDGFRIGVLLQAPLAELSRRVDAAYASAGFADVRPAHSVVFRLLPPEGERVTELAARAGASKQAMGYLVEYLVERGYLERAPDPTDGRAQIIRRTERGWEVNTLARDVVEATQTEWAAALGPKRFQQTLQVLTELASLLGAVYQDSISEISTRNAPRQPPSPSAPRTRHRRAARQDQ